MSTDTLPEWPHPREQPQRDDVRVYGLATARAMFRLHGGPVRVFAVYADGRGFRLIDVAEWSGDRVRNAKGRWWRIVGEVGAPEIARRMGYAASWPWQGTPCVVEAAA